MIHTFNREQKTWGAEIWEEKSQHHSDVGVILGTGFQSKDLDRNTQHTLSIMDRLGFRDLVSGSRILDIGVGPSARFSIALAKRGHLLTGLDASKEALRRASENAGRAGVKIQWLEADISDFSVPEVFDTVFCVETFFHLPAHLSLNAFSSFNRALKPDFFLFQKS